MSSVTQYQSGAPFTQTTAIPLTTVLTPNADCTAASAYVSTFWAGNQWAYQLDSGIRKPTCYPSDFSAYQYKSKLWYSPGVCPQSYQYVATSTISHDNAPATTFAVCCPPGIFTQAPEGGWSCIQVLTTAVQGGLSFANKATTTQAATTAFANPISVAWQESDLPLFTPASAPVLALKSAGVSLPAETTKPSTISGTTAPTSSAPTSNSRGGGLSTGAAAGIGVGAAVVGMLIIGLIWWLTRRYKFSRREKKQGGGEYSQAWNPQSVRPDEYKYGNHAPVQYAGPYEADDRNTRAELAS